MNKRMVIDSLQALLVLTTVAFALLIACIDNSMYVYIFYFLTSKRPLLKGGGNGIHNEK